MRVYGLLWGDCIQVTIRVPGVSGFGGFRVEGLGLRRPGALGLI